MKYLLFAPRFAEPIERRTKRQTIRDTRRCEPGDVVSLRRWTGRPYRSRQAEIVPPVLVEAVLPVRIRIFVGSGWADVRVGTDEIVGPVLASFVRRDGFKTVADFVSHWAARKYPSPFNGFVHLWAEVAGG